MVVAGIPTLYPRRIGKATRGDCRQHSSTMSFCAFSSILQ